MSAQQPWPGAVLSGDLDEAVGPVSVGEGDVSWAGTGKGTCHRKLPGELCKQSARLYSSQVLFSQ